MAIPSVDLMHLLEWDEYAIGRCRLAYRNVASPYSNPFSTKFTMVPSSDICLHVSTCKCPLHGESGYLALIAPQGTSRPAARGRLGAGSQGYGFRKRSTVTTAGSARCLARCGIRCVFD